MLTVPLNIKSYFLFPSEAIPKTPVGIRITLDQVNNGIWAIRDEFGNCLNKNGKWETEQQPSSRTVEFTKRTRFESLGVAYVFWLEYYEKHKKDFA